MALCQYVESNNAYYYERVIAVIIVDYPIILYKYTRQTQQPPQQL